MGVALTHQDEINRPLWATANERNKMANFVVLLEIEYSGRPKGHIVLNVDKIVHIRERALSFSQKCCVITTDELSVDTINAAEHNATASYSDSVLVGGSLLQVLSAMNGGECRYPDWEAAGLVDPTRKGAAR